MNRPGSAVVAYVLKILNIPGIKIFLKLLLAAAIFYFIARTISFDDLKREIINAKLVFIVIAFSLLIGRTLLMAWRWQMLLEIKDYRHPLRSLSTIYFIGFFFNNLLPTSIGGDVVRAVFLSRSSIKKGTAVSSILMERLLGIPALFLISSVSYLIGLDDMAVKSNTLHVGGKFVLFAGVAAFTIFLFPIFFRGQFFRFRPSSGILQKAVSVLIEFVEYWIRPINLVVALSITCVCQLCGILSVYFVSLAVGQQTSFIYFSFLLPIIWLAIILPISINGLGLREGMFVFLFGLADMSRQSAIAISLLWLTFVYAQSLIGGLLFLTNRIHHPDEGLISK